MEKTLILIKPDGIQRQLIGKIISRFEQKGLKLAAMKLTQISRETAEEHYKEHKERPFFGSLVDFMTSHPIVAMAFEGVGSVEICRKMTGATFGLKAEPGTIRGDYGISTSYNLIHSSEDVEAAKRELGIFFNDSDFVSYTTAITQWIVTDEDIEKAKS